VRRRRRNERIPEKASGGGEANETRHLVQSESTIARGTAPGAGEGGENAAIQAHTFIAQGATNVTVSRFVVDPSRIGPHEKLYIVHSGTSILVREASAGFLPQAAIVAIAAEAGAKADLSAHRACPSRLLRERRSTGRRATRSMAAYES
jgi:hypothetical protein